MSDAPPIIDHSAAFSNMARKIAENATNGFSGAFVVVPPDGVAADLLQLAGTSDAAVFWSTLKTIIDIELGKLQAAERGQRAGW